MISPVILSGGSGTRLWPLSRELYPKQLICLVGDRTLLQDTVARLDGVAGVSEPLIVCNEEHRFLIAEQLREIGHGARDIILEPAGRNTAPALTLAALTLEQAGNDDPMLVMPADHVIQDVKAFANAVAQAVPLAAAGRLVTFGIVPTLPETGYGYIRKGQNHDVAAFVEKPDADTAARYVASGEYFWNSGMFLIRPSVWIAELSRHRRDMLDVCRAAFADTRRDGDFHRVNKDAFLKCPSDSIDYAVMEKTDRASVIPLDAGWSDIGAWSALWQVSAQDDDGNVLRGDVHAHDTRNALLIAQSRFLAAVGIEDTIVIETPDAVLVAHKDSAQDVKAIVGHLKAAKRTEHQIHRKVYRPWGSYEGVDAGDRFQVKRLIVKPGASLSLQMHHHRAEHWVVVRGTARVTRGEDVFLLSENQSTYIPIGAKHRLENPGAIPLEIIEVQSGSYLGEDDIVRFEDTYNRHKNS
jgi:mannose-1-phosphate guanylyltransferase/mannose-1-phosphate guanylyltransferase/mannose-6-phosphate isomerase